MEFGNCWTANGGTQTGSQRGPAKHERLAQKSERLLKAVLAATLISAVMGLSSYDSGWSSESDKNWNIGNCEISEKIEISNDTVPDASYRPTYWLIRRENRLSVGSYENESSDGEIKEPFVVEDFIVQPLRLPGRTGQSGQSV